MNAAAAAPPERLRNCSHLPIAWFLSPLPLKSSLDARGASMHIGSIERIARGASITPEPRGLVGHQLVWLGFSASAPEITTDALQLLSVYFFVPADRLDRLFHAGPAQSFGSGGMAGAGLAGVLLGEQLAVRAAARGLDRVQLCDRPAADLEKAAPRLAFCGPCDRRR